MDEILYKKDERNVAWVTLNRPEARNALSKAVNLRLIELAKELSADKSLRAVVLSGAGDRAFCAGADLKERKGVTAEQTGAFVDAISGAISAWEAIPAVTLAVVNGFAFGGGTELALACDLRIASSNAQFGLTEVRLGIMPGAGGTQRLPRLIGVAAAKNIILRGNRIKAEEAKTLGLVVDVVEQKDLKAKTDEILSDLLACAPRSLEMAKKAIDTGIEQSLSEGLKIERQCYDVTLFTEDRNEGLRAFSEKRKAVFTGK